jgi:hypothetical protein
MLAAGGILTIMHVLPLLVIFAIVGLELSIAFFTSLRIYCPPVYISK